MFNLEPETLIGREMQRSIQASAEASAAGEAHGPEVALEVMPTDQLLNLVESSAYDLVNPHLQDGYRTVGISVDFRHFAPTPQGQQVTALVRLVGVEGGKCLFEFSVRDEVETVCTGTYANFVVDIAHFRKAVADKNARRITFKQAAV